MIVEMLTRDRFRALFPAGLPPVHDYEIATVIGWLKSRYPSQRPAKAQAGTLVLIVHLWSRREAFPPRVEVAEHLGVSREGVDNALKKALSRELIVKEVETRGDKALTFTYYIPSDELVAVVQGAN